MKYFISVSCSFFIMLGGIFPSYADEAIPIARIRPLVEWVETRTNLMLLPRPRIFISGAALRKLTGDAANAESETHERIGAYRHGVIFISDAYWQPGDIADDSVLVHELVHYAQDVGGQHYDCANQREAEAYRMQNLFLREHGERPFLNDDEVEKLKICE